MKKITILLFAATLSADSLFAQSTQQDVWRFGVDGDMFAYVFAAVGSRPGYSLHLYIKPSSPRHFTFGAAVHSHPLPEALLGQKDKGWKATHYAYQLEGHYFFREDRRGFLAGTFLMFIDWRYTFGGETARVKHLAAGPLIGYQWFPFHKSGFYVRPWLVMVSNLSTSGEAKAGGKNFEESPVVLVLALHFGHEF